MPQAPFAGGSRGCPPDFLMTSLGRAGLPAGRQVGRKALMLRRPHRRPPLRPTPFTRRGAGFIPRTAIKSSVGCASRPTPPVPCLMPRALARGRVVKGECGEGESLPARGFGGCPPDFLMTSLGRAGLPAGRQVGATTLMLRRPHRRCPSCPTPFTRKGAGFIPQTACCYPKRPSEAGHGVQ